MVQDFVYQESEPFLVGQHGETSFVYVEDQPVENLGTPDIVSEEGFNVSTAAPSGDFTVKIADTNSPVGETGSLVVDVDVTNNQSTEQAGTITLTVGDVTRDGISIEIPGNNTSGISLVWETSDGDAGDYTALVESGTDEDSTDVTVEDVQNPDEKTITIGGDGKGGDLNVSLPYTARDTEGGDDRTTVIEGLDGVRFVAVKFSFDQDATYRQSNAGLGFCIGPGCPSSITDFAMSLSFQENGSKTVTAVFDNGSAESGDLIFGVDDGTGTFDSP